MVGMSLVVRLVLAVFVLCSLLLTTRAQTTCSSHIFTDNKMFSTCRDLPHLTSYLHWNYDESTGKLDLAFRHGGINATDRWVAWAINPNNNLNSAMVGAQALVAITQSGVAPKAYTSSISGYGTRLAESNISYATSGLSATREGNEITIFATITLPAGTTSLVHLWNDGPLSGSTPQAHDTISAAHIQSKESLDLRSASSPGSSPGSSPPGSSSGSSLIRRRNKSSRESDPARLRQD